MTSLNDFLGVWKVNAVQYHPNVRTETAGQASRITLTRNVADPPNKVRCTNVTPLYVLDSAATDLPVKWTQAVFTFDVQDEELAGSVASANDSPCDVVFTVASGTITCTVNGSSSPGGQWTGTHP